MQRLAASALLVLAACGGDGAATIDEPTGQAGPSAVLITLDTTIPGALDPYRGSKPSVTPHLAALASEGVVFNRARTVAPLTFPAHASMLTGLYPIRHGVRDNGHVALPRSARTVAEAAQERGLDTAAFLAAGVLARGFGLEQGFDVYEAPAAENEKGGFPTRWAGAVTDEALAWLDQHDGGPFFLWVHYFDPHLPYDPPPRFAKRFPGEPYLAEVAKMDHHVGRVLTRLEDVEDLLIVVVADHGEGFGANGELTHGNLLHDATLRVPLIVRFPGARTTGRRDDLVSVVDVAPTLASHLGLQSLAGIDGRNLAHPIERDGVYAEAYTGFLSYGWAPLVGWASAEGLYVHGPRPAVETSASPELRPAPDAPWIATARERIEALGNAPALVRDEGDRIDTDLSSLGYAAGFDIEIPPPLEIPTYLPAPRDRLDEPDRIFQALAAADSGKLDQAIVLLEGIAASNERNAFAHDQLANLYLRADRAEDAVAALHKILEAGMERSTVRRRLAKAHLALGEKDEARAELKRLLVLLPGDEEAKALLASLD